MAIMRLSRKSSSVAVPRQGNESARIEEALSSAMHVLPPPRTWRPEEPARESGTGMDNIAFEKIMQVVNRLISLTRQRRIHWEEAGRPDTFAFSTASSSVTVGTTDGDGAHPMFVNILDKQGDIVDRLTTTVDRDYWREWFDVVGELHTLARRSATDADKVIDALLAELPDDEPIL